MKRRRAYGIVMAFGIVVLTGAGCDDPLSESAVTTIPPGSAVGTTLSGDYQIELVTTSCEGVCAPVKVTELETISVCDLGFRHRSKARVTQTNGALQLDVDDLLFASRLVGGVDADGSFDIGGVKTEASQSLTLRTRFTGKLDAGSGLGTVRTYSTGRADLPEQRCESRHELRLTR